MNTKNMLPVSILCPKTNQSAYAITFLLITTFASTFRSVFHIIYIDGGAESVAGLDISNHPNRSNIIALLGHLGISQLIIAVINWFILTKYQEFILYAILIQSIECSMHIIFGVFYKPFIKINNSIPIGAYLNALVALIGFIIFFYQIK